MLSWPRGCSCSWRSSPSLRSSPRLAHLAKGFTVCTKNSASAPSSSPTTLRPPSASWRVSSTPYYVVVPWSVSSPKDGLVSLAEPSPQRCRRGDGQPSMSRPRAGTSAWLGSSARSAPTGPRTAPASARRRPRRQCRRSVGAQRLHGYGSPLATAVSASRSSSKNGCRVSVACRSTMTPAPFLVPLTGAPRTHRSEESSANRYGQEFLESFVTFSDNRGGVYFREPHSFHELG
jgi:hypothetical protein